MKKDVRFCEDLLKFVREWSRQQEGPDQST